MTKRYRQYFIGDDAVLNEDDFRLFPLVEYVADNYWRGWHVAWLWWEYWKQETT